MTANKATIALVVLAVLSVLLGAGVALSHHAPPAVAQSTSDVAPATLSSQYSMADIDNALATGPVFVEFETTWCPHCKEQHPISAALADEYKGKVTFFFVNAEEDRALANQFQANAYPQMDVIASKSGGGYTYVDNNGKASNSIAASRFLGTTDRNTLKTALDAAVQMRTT